MRIRFWGTRGSLPAPMRDEGFRSTLNRLVSHCQANGLSTLDDLVRHVDQRETPLTYGGNTSCVEIATKDQSLFVDFGTGVRELGTKYIKTKKEYVFFLTHLHWDHLIGLPYFLPIYSSDCRISIYHVHPEAPDSISRLFNTANFPIPFNKLGCKFEFHQMKVHETVVIGDTSVTPFNLDHPGKCYGYRFDCHGHSAAIGFDSEFRRVTQKDLGPDLKFYQNLDLLVFDAQYELEDLVNKFDWGHCSPNIGIDLALREGVRNLVLFHHDPWATDEQIHQGLEKAQNYLIEQAKALSKTPPKLIPAYDGLEVKLPV